MCCACGAGDLNLENEDLVLVNDDYYKDSQGKTCSEYYTDQNTHKCGSYDTVDFKAEEMCVSCGGGMPELSVYCTQTRALIENQKDCYTDID